MASDSPEQPPSDRFDHVEMGPDLERARQTSDDGKCAYCGAANEPGRNRCRGCFRKLPRTATDQKSKTAPPVAPPPPVPHQAPLPPNPYDYQDDMSDWTGRSGGGWGGWGGTGGWGGRGGYDGGGWSRYPRRDPIGLVVYIVMTILEMVFFWRRPGRWW